MTMMEEAIKHGSDGGAPLIRELVQYRDLINLRTQEPEE
jgi:hypothetical protein